MEKPGMEPTPLAVAALMAAGVREVLASAGPIPPWPLEPWHPAQYVAYTVDPSALCPLTPLVAVVVGVADPPPVPRLAT